ncbi:DUF935 domain-containing protein [Photobacterium sanguinicancri]|uniref:DUF935 domain-containing protein n=1 Tax=Photobacterium sanguinicancri TaxID=875932 RepID=A0ABX4FSX2_9GAMM|nr:DUF935 domain-containing protein [Photobacterium sanguinicancri]OZS41964.1 hypothetical protein ASV53_20925 [Photobacterium sanguinicancri]
MATSPIVDLWGRPIETADLDEQQTEADSRLIQLKRHFAGHPSSGLTPAKLAGIMKRAEDGDLIAQCELAEDMEEKDAHIQSELAKRKMALLNIDWNIRPPRNATAQEQRDADMLQELLEDATWLEDALFDMADATLKTFSNLELKWEIIEGMHSVSGYDHRDPSWFQTHPDNRNQLRLRNGSHEGAELNPFGWISHTAKAKSGYLSRRGLVRVLAWPFLFKNYSIRDLAEFLEIYGLPIRLGKYPEGATEREKSTLLRAVMSIGHNAGGIIPKGMDIDFQNAADGASDPFMAMVNWCEKSQSKAILGGTLTSQADGKTSTNALGNVHNEVREEIRDFDLKRIAATLTRDLVFPLYALNGKSYRNRHRIPRFEFDLTEAEDIQMLSTALPGLVGLGMRIPLEWAHDKTQIPQAKDGEAILGSVQQPDPKSQAELKGLAVLKAQANKPDTADLQAERLQQEAGGLMANMFAPVRELVESATSLPELRESILQLQGVISTEELGEVMAQAMAAAELAGISDVTDGK